MNRNGTFSPAASSPGISDAQDRELALDIGNSFIVQAPAGSGKTGLLTQRFLALLAHAREPENVLAITFTRKAAAEMRARVMAALHAAQVDGSAGSEPGAPGLDPSEADASPGPPLSRGAQDFCGAGDSSSETFDACTRRLAKAVLATDRDRAWGILDAPARLRVTTIDALCLGLCSQLPWLSGLGGPVVPADEPERLYRLVAEQMLDLLDDPEWSADLCRVLDHLDTDPVRFTSLIVEMLGRRDQWLRHVADDVTDFDVVRCELETAMGRVVSQDLSEVANLLTEAGLGASVTRLAAYAGEGVSSAGTDHAVAKCAGLGELPAPHAGDLPAWRGVAALFLTVAGGWRKRFDKSCGFAQGRPDVKAWKAEAADFVADLSTIPGLRGALQRIPFLPSPQYAEADWEVLSSLIGALRLAAGLLRVIFAERGQTDFIEVVSAASRALGTDDQPTDLALALDHQIHHLLVDEFQDTSHSHERFLAALLAGWEPGDGRTVFLVGDPMQSIYRFREADVGVFLRAREAGIGPVRPLSIILQSNFRSRPAVLEWTNSIFPRVLAAVDDVSDGAVSYRPCIPVREAGDTAAKPTTETTSAGRGGEFNGCSSGALTEGVRLHLVPRESQRPHSGQPKGVGGAQIHDVESILAAALAEQAWRKADGSVAVLARSRSHLTGVLGALQAKGIPCEEVGIETFADVATVRDLGAIARALLHLADRVAWLALLRAPWCGLTLSELHAVAGSDSSQTVWRAVNDQNRCSGLVPGSAHRLERVRAVMADALASVGRRSFRDRVEGAWLNLGGPGTEDRNRLREAALFLDALDRCERDGLDLDADQIGLLLSRNTQGGNGPLAGELDVQAALSSGASSPDAPSPDARTGDCLTHEASTAAVQLMTIHRAKGLEFDTVILPGLARSARTDRRPLMIWSEQLGGREVGPNLLMAPIPGYERPGVPSESAAFDYLWQRQRAQDAHETGRLLYVAMTRARERLHLVASLDRDRQGDLRPPSAKSLLGTMWGAIDADDTALVERHSGRGPAGRTSPGQDIGAPATSGAGDTSLPEQGTSVRRCLRRFPSDWIPDRPRPSIRVDMPVAGAADPERAAAPVEFDWATENARLVGILVHRVLRQVGTMGLETWQLQNLRSESEPGASPGDVRPHRLSAWRDELELMGIPADELPAALDAVGRAVSSAVSSARGRWVLGSGYKDAHCELALTGVVDGELRRSVIDRTFLDADDYRWIVDYKTGTHEGADLRAFIDRERQRYQPQLEAYAQLLDGPRWGSKRSDRRMRLGLYFPMLGEWREWFYTPLRAGRSD